MNILFFKILHLSGVICLFTSIGATLLSGSNKKSASILHGIALLTLLVAGFAILKKPPMDQSWWMVKIGLWLFLGAAPAIAKRKLLPQSIVLLLSIAAGIFAAYLGIAKPF